MAGNAANKKLKIAIIGGGIGGLSAALSLLRAGFDVHVYEQSPTFREVGAGIQVSPNASRVLHGLGLAKPLAEIGVRPLAFHQKRWQDGRTILKTPLGDAVEAAFGFPYYQVYRADLLAMLVAAPPRERLHAGHRLTAFSETNDGIDLEFDNGARTRADVLIGADGIHSTVRHILFGAEVPRFTGVTAYRGLIRAERVAHLDVEVTTQVWMGPGSHLVTYFVAGMRLLNFVANVEREAWTAESWSECGNPDDLRAAFATWDPTLRAILEGVEETFIWGIFDRAPLPRWSAGRATLLGDACHPMQPHMAQGAAQAIEDGAALAACLRKFGDVPEALARYENLRKARTAHVQSLATANKTRFHLPDGPEQAARDAKMAAGGTDWSLATIGWLYGYDAEAAVESGNLGLPAAAR
jgi:salicylate hydroxylase